MFSGVAAPNAGLPGERRTAVGRVATTKGRRARLDDLAAGNPGKKPGTFLGIGRFESHCSKNVKSFKGILPSDLVALRAT
jgi:hypothetical protein